MAPYLVIYRLLPLAIYLVVMGSWLTFTITTDIFVATDAINYADVVSESVTLFMIAMMLIFNLKLTRKTIESVLFFYALLIMLCSHAHDILDEFVVIKPAVLALMLENIASIIGLLMILIALYFWSEKYHNKIRNLKQETVSLTSQSHQDALTGLLNRRYLQEVLFAELQATSKVTENMTLMMIDLDNFKTFNDSFGHVAGDKLIQHAGQVIANECREKDKVVRYGGEEFLVIIYAKTEIAKQVAERIRQRYNESVFEIDNTRIYKSLSVGIAPLNHAVNFETDLHLADEALYMAKKSGKNQVIIAK
ncbi:GGDEF domain-containing protein [Gayadomonas joobiniege]|uniref:GGDEF domain-containing protein n=1 Tax=Gayadomonas joobiniege TaxID=1234606 RepID=UPI00037EF3E0|nr:GGDEF domain-containing protein [Gayadomonas joobiniege]